MTSGFCSFNLSIGILNTLEGRVAWIKNNKIGGIVGKVFDRLLNNKLTTKNLSLEALRPPACHQERQVTIDSQ